MVLEKLRNVYKRIVGGGDLPLGFANLILPTVLVWNNSKIAGLRQTCLSRISVTTR